MIVPSLQIVIVNWRTGDFLRECIASIEQTDWTGLRLEELTIVDNDSSDGSLEGLSRTSLPLRVIDPKENIGFSRACNRGARESKSDFVLFLNPDTRVEATTLSQSVANHREVFGNEKGILGVQLKDCGGRVSSSCSRFPSFARIAAKSLGLSALMPVRFQTHWMHDFDHLNSRFVDCVMGAFILCPRGVFEELGGFDERFFVYYEEVDLSYRAAQHGIRTWFDATVCAVHVGRGSTERVKGTRLFYSWRSRIQYAMLHFPRVHAWGVVALTYLVEPGVRVAASIVRFRLGDALSTWDGYRALLLNSGRMLRGRN